MPDEKIKLDKIAIGEWADYLVCDPDGLTNNGIPVMEPPEAAFAVLCDLKAMVERMTGADPETLKSLKQK